MTCNCALTSFLFMAKGTKNTEKMINHQFVTDLIPSPQMMLEEASFECWKEKKKTLNTFATKLAELIFFFNYCNSIGAISL